MLLILIINNSMRYEKWLVTPATHSAGTAVSHGFTCVCIILRCILENIIFKVNNFLHSYLITFIISSNQ